MPPVRIAEVRGLSWPTGLSATIAYFTDEGMANQAVETLYQKVRSLATVEPFQTTAFVDLPLAETIRARGFENWMIDDKNGPTPMFWVVRHGLWNQVPVWGPNLEALVPEDLHPVQHDMRVLLP